MSKLQMWIHLNKAPQSLSTTQVINVNYETTVHHFSLQCVKPCQSRPREFVSPPIPSSPCHSAQKKYLPCIPNTSRAQRGGGSRVAHVRPRVSTQWTSGEIVTPSCRSHLLTRIYLPPHGHLRVACQPFQGGHICMSCKGLLGTQQQSNSRDTRDWASTQNSQQKMGRKGIKFKCVVILIHRGPNHNALL